MGKLKSLDPLIEEVIKDQLYQDKDIVKNIINLINNNISTPFSIALSGPWGSGKTMLLKLVQEELEKKLYYPTIWFNPWEYDNSDDIVLSLLKCIALEFRDRFKFSLKELGIFGLTLITASIDILARMTTKDSVSYANIKDIQKDVTEALGKETYDAFEDEISAMKKDFVNLTQKVSKKYDSKPLIIFFDDLDRCLPDNALKLLEALKNLFVIKEANVIIISAIDTEVAKSFIRNRYKGIEENFAINYFRKVFNLTLELPLKTPELLKTYLINYIEILFETKNSKPEEGLHGDISNIKNIAVDIINMANISGTKSLRALLNIINNYFIMKKTTTSALEFKSSLPILFMKEVWNKFYELLKIEALKLDGKVIGKVMDSKVLIDLYNKDEKLRQFWDNFVKNEIEVRELRNANLI